MEERTSHKVYTERQSPNIFYPVDQIVSFLLGTLEFGLALRVLFAFLGANQTAFVAFVNNFTEPFVSPFQGIFGLVSQGQFFIDWAAIIAMVIWAIIAYLITGFIRAALSPLVSLE